MNKRTIVPVCISLLLALTACDSSKNPSTSIPVGDNTTDSTSVQRVTKDETINVADPDFIAQRVTTIYEAVAEAYPEINDIAPSNDLLDDAYCSSEWNALVAMVNAKDAENMGREGFFDSDYWIMGNEWGNISISDLNVQTKDELHASTTFTLHNRGAKTKVRLELVFERGEWLIGNFIDESHQRDWKKAMLKHLEAKGKKEAKEKADDGVIEYERALVE